MSRRVIGSTVEQFTFSAILDRASRAGDRRIVGEYIPTAKNALVRDLHDTLGFRPHVEIPGGGHLHGFDVGGAETPVTFVALGPQSKTA